MNKQFIDLVRAKFEAALQEKTGWGRNEIINLYDRCVSEAAMELMG